MFTGHVFVHNDGMNVIQDIKIYNMSPSVPGCETSSRPIFRVHGASSTMPRRRAHLLASCTDSVLAELLFSKA